MERDLFKVVARIWLCSDSGSIRLFTTESLTALLTLCENECKAHSWVLQKGVKRQSVCASV